jgi:hypothetical protein
MTQFLDYQETYQILHDRINANHIEVQYWARNICHLSFIDFSIEGKSVTTLHCQDLFSHTDLPFLLPFISDLPDQEKSYMFPSLPFDPTLCFFWKENVLNFLPPPHDRLVQIKDLSARLWTREARSEGNPYSDFPALEKAAQNGILRFYDQEIYKFTYHKKSNSSCPDKLWYYTSEGEKYLRGQEGEFFLLQDIVNIERIFFNRPRKECLEELGFDPNDKDFQ